MEEPKNLKPRARRVSDVIDSIDGGLLYTNEHGIVSTQKKIIGTRGADSLGTWGYGSVNSGKPMSSVSPDSDAYPSSPKKFFKFPRGNFTDACPMKQDIVMSFR